jgi:anti-anti-sigma factor
MAPQQQTFEATVRHETGTAIIDLIGDINGFADEALNEAYSEAEAFDVETIMLNFNQVGYINSTGIALIVGLLAKARQTNKQLVTYGLSEHYLEIFHITRLSDFMTIVADEEAAMMVAA